MGSPYLRAAAEGGIIISRIHVAANHAEEKSLMMPFEDKKRFPLDWKDACIALGLGIFSLIMYVRTLVPGLLPNDGAEFQTLAYTVDHAHTTGYEVYTVLAKLFTLAVPVGDIAYRVNLLSAVYGALTVALISLAGRVLSGSRWGGAFGALVVAISATFWSQAIIAEVYTAGSTFSAAILVLVLLWHETDRPRFLFAAGVLGGLAIGVHNTNSLFAPAILVLILLHRRGFRVADLRKVWLPAAGGAGLGLVLMVGLFAFIDAHGTSAGILQAGYLPSISRWDLTPADLSTFGGRFRFLVFARQWRSAMFSDPARVMPGNLVTLLKTLPQDFSLPALLLLAGGLLSLLIRRPRLGLFFIVALAVHTAYTLNYRIGDLYVFFVSLYVYLGALMAEGLAALLRLLERLPASARRVARPSLALLVLVLALAPFSSQRMAALADGQIRFAFMQLPSNAELASWHTGLSSRVRELPKNAVLLTDWTRLYGYYYAAHVEQGRTDLSFVESYPYSTKQAIAESMFAYIKASIHNGRPVFTDWEIYELRSGGLTTSRGSAGFIVQIR